MAVKIVGNWELSWNSPIKEIELWNLPLRDFGVEDFYMFPVSGVRNRERAVNLHEFKDLDEILEELGDWGTRVFVEAAFPTAEPDHQFLPEFTHPEDAIYIFGSAHYNPCSHRKRTEDLALAIPTKGMKGVLWPHQCAVTILYDRMVKSCQSS